MNGGHLIALDDDECRELLATRSTGRLAWQDADGVMILPVTHAVVGTDLVMRTQSGSTLASLEVGQRVAFEVDELDEDTRTGWNVVAKGTVASLDTYPDEDSAVRAGAPGLTWAPGDRRNVLVIAVSSLSGRAVSSDEPAEISSAPLEEESHVD
ncbi:pyridoxamine 5'-phosphate oxidase family protein [Acidipropionibacterium timonense]|uniref:pyridoxamine 5'-phosphate oxidase family protein n=1 Tax=Acidipropionibacterium timonense TaxID=2161818 RepID=UPI001031B1C5|nr:pyridoxamine 5'-phosphate oxidase family protein [Acidipropionibacterium timonense]